MTGTIMTVDVLRVALSANLGYLTVHAWAFVALCLLQVLDVVTTVYALRQFGDRLAEGNPLVAYLVRHLGALPGVLVSKLAITVPCLWLIYRCLDDRSFLPWTLVLTTVIYVVIVANNLRLIARAERR